MVSEKPRVIAIDFETYYDKDCSVRTLGAWAYCRHPEFYAYLMSVSDGEETWVGEPKDFDWTSLEGAHLISHNAFFDRNVYEHGVEIGLYPKINFAQWDCTANMSACLCNRRSLKDAALFLLGVEMSKDCRDDMKGKHWKDVRDTPLGTSFKEYAARDAKICWDIWNGFADRWSEFEKNLSRQTIEQCMFGIQIDVPLLERYLNDAKKLLFQIEKKLPWIESEDAKPTSTKAIAMACRAAGIPTPPVKCREGEEAYDAWEKTYSKLYSWIGAVAQWRSLNKFIGTLETIQSRLRPDGTLSFGLKYFGAHTGRWSGDAGFNIQNLKRDPILVDVDFNLRLDDASIDEYNKLKEDGQTPEWLGKTNWGLEKDEGFPYGAPAEERWQEAIHPHIYDIRSLICARPGKKLVLCDLAQIEPRVLAWLAGHERLLAAIRDGFGVYEAAAVATGKYSGAKGGFKKLKALYQAQKAQTLALGFGCGWERYIEAAYTLARYDVCKNDRIDPKTGKTVYGSAARAEVSQFREDNKEIPALWAALDKSFRESLDSDFMMELPTGRFMTYRNVQRRRKKKSRDIINEETGEVIETKIEERWVYSAEIDGRRYELYGGALTENITQAVAREVFAFLMLELVKAGKRVLFSVHDEAICEVDLDEDPKVIEKLMSVTPEWLDGCPIGAEAKESPHYLK